MSPRGSASKRFSDLRSGQESNARLDRGDAAEPARYGRWVSRLTFDVATHLLRGATYVADCACCVQLRVSRDPCFAAHGYKCQILLFSPVAIMRAAAPVYTRVYVS